MHFSRCMYHECQQIIIPSIRELICPTFQHGGGERVGMDPGDAVQFSYHRRRVHVFQAQIGVEVTPGKHPV